MDGMVEIKQTISSEVNSLETWERHLVWAEHTDMVQFGVSVYSLPSSKDCFLACNYIEQ